MKGLLTAGIAVAVLLSATGIVMAMGYYMKHKIKPFPAPDNFFFFSLPTANCSNPNFKDQSDVMCSFSDIRIGAPEGPDRIHGCIVMPDRKAYAQIVRGEGLSAKYTYIPIGTRLDSGKIQFDNLVNIYYTKNFSLAGDKYQHYAVITNTKEYTARQIIDQLPAAQKEKVVIAKIKYSPNPDSSVPLQSIVADGKPLASRSDWPTFASQNIKLVLFESAEFENLKAGTSVEIGGVLIGSDFLRIGTITVFFTGQERIASHADAFYGLRFPIDK